MKEEKNLGYYTAREILGTCCELAVSSYHILCARFFTLITCICVQL